MTEYKDYKDALCRACGDILFKQENEICGRCLRRGITADTVLVRGPEPVLYEEPNEPQQQDS